MVFCFRRNSLLDSARRRTEINKLRYYYYYYKSTYSSFSVNSCPDKPQHSHGARTMCFQVLPVNGQRRRRRRRRQVVSRAHRFSCRHAVASRGRIRPPPPSGFHTRGVPTSELSRPKILCRSRWGIVHARTHTREAHVVRTQAGRDATTTLAHLNLKRKKQRSFIPRE